MPNPARTLPLSLLLLACVVSSAGAQGASTNLSWDHCAGDGRVADRTFACDTNVGEDVIFLSVVLHDSTQTGVVAWDAYLDFTPTTASLPLWWSTLAGQCHANAVGVLTNWNGVTLPPTSCLPWYGSDVLSVTGRKAPAPDRFTIEVTTAMPAPATTVLLAGQEYNLCRIRIVHTKTVGAGACEGCAVPTCIGVSRLTLFAESHNDYYAGAGLNSVTWQGGYVASYPTVSGRPCSHPSLCPYINRLECTAPPVPARGQTWGVIKTLYR